MTTIDIVQYDFKLSVHFGKKSFSANQRQDIISCILLALKWGRNSVRTENVSRKVSRVNFELK